MATAVLWIVDDDEDDVLLMQRAAQGLTPPCQLTCFSSGADLLAHLQTPQELPHLLIIDYHLPGMNALELTQQVRHCSGWKQVPILWMSGQLDPGWEELGRPLGVSQHWTKPFTYSAWQEFMQQICN